MTMTPDSVFADRIKVVETMLGSPVDQYGFSTCPGQHLHQKSDGPRHFRIFGLKGPNTHGNCFHTHCKPAVTEFNRALQEQLILAGANVWPWEDADLNGEELVRYKSHWNMEVDEAAIAKVVADVLPWVGHGSMLEWLESRSPSGCAGIHGFLSGLFPEPADRVLLFTQENTQGQMVWHRDLGDGWESGYRERNKDGVWFLIQPVTGEYLTIPRLKTKWNPSGRTRRAAENALEFRYLLLESDCTDLDAWVRILVQLPMPIVAVTSSGSRSLHALVYVGAADRAGWEEFRYGIEKLVVKYGCDKGALRAVQLSRLPGCLRYGKTRADGVWEPFAGGPVEQRLWYFDPAARSQLTILEKYV